MPSAGSPTKIESLEVSIGTESKSYGKNSRKVFVKADRASRSAKMVFREDNVIVIEVGSLTTRAVVGLAESMTPPQVRVPTKIGIKRASQAQQPQYLFDSELEDAIRAKDPELTVIQPIVKGMVKDWEAIEIFW
jgi:actin-related protein